MSTVPGGQGASGVDCGIARRLKRDRSAVKRDVDTVVRASLLEVTEKPLPGHGRRKEVRASAARIYLSATVE